MCNWWVRLISEQMFFCDSEIGLYTWLLILEFPIQLQYNIFSSYSYLSNKPMKKTLRLFKNYAMPMVVGSYLSIPWEFQWEWVGKIASFLFSILLNNLLAIYPTTKDQVLIGLFFDEIHNEYVNWVRKIEFNQPTNQSINQSINQQINQFIICLHILGRNYVHRRSFVN